MSPFLKHRSEIKGNNDKNFELKEKKRLMDIGINVKAEKQWRGR